MGVSVWTFLQSKPGEIFPVAQHAMDDFPDNTGRLPPDEEGFVRICRSTFCSAAFTAGSAP